jgi:protein-tyrosine-phosphatase
MPAQDPHVWHVLFLSTGNAGRSQMAEAWVASLSGGRVRASSAGTHPGTVNPMTVTAMAEAGVDISGRRAKGLDDVDVGSVTHVVTVCEQAAANGPAFPREVVRRHWPVPDPGDMPDEFRHLTADGFRAIRDNLRDRARMFLVELGVAPVDPGPAAPRPKIDSGGGAA